MNADDQGRSSSRIVSRTAELVNSRVYSEPKLPCSKQQGTFPGDDGQEYFCSCQDGNAGSKELADTQEPAEDKHCQWLLWQQEKGKQRQFAQKLISAISRCSCPRCCLDCLHHSGRRSHELSQYRESELLDWVIPIANCTQPNNRHWQLHSPTKCLSSSQGSRWLPPPSVCTSSSVDPITTTGLTTADSVAGAIHSTRTAASARSMAATSSWECSRDVASRSRSSTVAAELHRLSARLAGNRLRRGSSGGCIRPASARGVSRCREGKEDGGEEGKRAHVRWRRGHKTSSGLAMHAPVTDSASPSSYRQTRKTVHRKSRGRRHTAPSSGSLRSCIGEGSSHHDHQEQRHQDQQQQHMQSQHQQHLQQYHYQQQEQPLQQQQQQYLQQRRIIEQHRPSRLEGQLRLQQRVRGLLCHPPRAVMRLAQAAAQATEGDARSAVAQCLNRQPVKVS